MCGEKECRFVLWKDNAGSPPHMRGKGKSQNRTFSCKGITPAHAGKSIEIVTSCDVCGDHPRTCGEKAPKKVNGAEKRGSPPHMRGKVCIIWQVYRRR